MIKQDIVHQVIERTGLPRTKAEAAVDTVFEGLKQALTAGERIELRGFGVFSVRARKTGIGRNPRTGTEVSITPVSYTHLDVYKRQGEHRENGPHVFFGLGGLERIGLP